MHISSVRLARVIGYRGQRVHGLIWAPCNHMHALHTSSRLAGAIRYRRDRKHGVDMVATQPHAARYTPLQPCMARKGPALGSEPGN